MKALERMLNYIRIPTASDPQSTAAPSSACQLRLAELLTNELLSLGIADAHMSSNGHVYASIPASAGLEQAPSIGFISHMDTAPDFCGENIHPQIIEHYDGRDVPLGISGRILSVRNFPHLPSLAGRTLITTDGTTLLGADDKAGIAAIMTAAEKLIRENIPHGKVCIGFTPDEEIGRGADDFDIHGFGADYAYTVDGGIESEIIFENFNACMATFEIDGFHIHPGEAKNRMKNASVIAFEIHQMLPSCDRPEHTEQYEGFYHLWDITGTAEHAKLTYVVRDHDSDSFAWRKKTLKQIEKNLNETYGNGTVTLTITDQYRNMAELLRPCRHLIDTAIEVIRGLGLEPELSPARGGTDGATLTYMGLPCPGLGMGGYAYHGPYEHITAEALDTTAEIILGIIQKYANTGQELPAASQNHRIPR